MRSALFIPSSSLPDLTTCDADPPLRSPIQIMTALETFATIHLRAKTLTVNTKALDPTDGVSDAKNVKWYKRRGYVEFQVCVFTPLSGPSVRRSAC